MGDTRGFRLTEAQIAAAQMPRDTEEQREAAYRAAIEAEMDRVFGPKEGVDKTPIYVSPK